MSDVKKSPDAIFNQNMAVMSASLELGAAAIQRVMGRDEASTHVGGEPLKTKDIQELLAAKMAKAFDR